MTSVPRSTPQLREQVIDALIPATVTPQPSPLPLAALPPPPRRRAGDPVVFDVGRLDRSGRVGVATLLRSLGWQPADQIDLDVADASVLVTATPHGRHRIGGRGEIGLPTAIRTLCGMSVGQPVFMAALVTHDAIIIHPAHTITRLLAPTHTRLVTQLTGGDRHAR